MINPRQDVFGYYKVGDFKSYSKFEAALEHKRTNHRVEWIFNDPVWASFDWTVDPAESLEELYRQRAQTLRDQYDYLVLWYSGGADSQNILDVFLDNGIKLDELATYTTYSATGNRSDKMNGEVFNVAVPTAAKAKERQPWLIHTVIDQCQMIMDHFERADTKFDWTYQSNVYVNPNAMSRPIYIKQSQPHWQKMFDAGKRVGFIHGSDKPQVIGINGRYTFHFVDMIEAVRSPVQQMLDRSWEFDELFYWSPSAPKIVIKQAHIIKRYLEHVTEQSPNIVLDHPTSAHCATTKNGKILYLPSNGINPLIYPKWYPVPFQVKPLSLIFSHRDDWFFNMSNSESAKYSWKTGLEYRWQMTPDSLKNDPSRLSSGFKHTRSRYYNL